MIVRAILALCGFQQSFARRLQSALGRRVELFFEDIGNRRIFVTPEPGGKLKIHLDPLFEQMDDQTFEVLVQFIQHGAEEDKQKLIEYLQSAREANPLPKDEHALQHMLDTLQQEYFPRLPKLSLVWGKLGKRGKQKSIRLASFWPDRLEIRLHPYILDDRVPVYYQQYLLYHELCHAWLMLSGKAKSGEHHGPDFYALEDQFAEIKKSRFWEKEKLGEFLSQAQNID